MCPCPGNPMLCLHLVLLHSPDTCSSSSSCSDAMRMRVLAGLATPRGMPAEPAASMPRHEASSECLHSRERSGSRLGLLGWRRKGALSLPPFREGDGAPSRRTINNNLLSCAGD